MIATLANVAAIKREKKGDRIILSMGSPR